MVALHFLLFVVRSVRSLKSRMLHRDMFCFIHGDGWKRAHGELTREGVFATWRTVWWNMVYGVTTAIVSRFS